MTRYTDYRAYMDSIGADMGNWDKAYADTKACAVSANQATTPVGRMKAFIECRKGKKVAKA